MKPFVLDQALNGAPVVTRDGQPVTNITLFDGVDDDLHNDPLYGVVDGVLESWSTDGQWRDGEDPLDLFMAPIVKEGWVSIYKMDTHTWGVSGPVYPLREDVPDTGLRVAQVRWEVEA